MAETVASPSRHLTWDEDPGDEDVQDQHEKEIPKDAFGEPRNIAVVRAIYSQSRNVLKKTLLTEKEPKPLHQLLSEIDEGAEDAKRPEKSEALEAGKPEQKSQAASKWQKLRGARVARSAFKKKSPEVNKERVEVNKTKLRAVVEGTRQVIQMRTTIQSFQAIQNGNGSLHDIQTLLAFAMLDAEERWNRLRQTIKGMFPNDEDYQDRFIREFQERVDALSAQLASKRIDADTAASQAAIVDALQSSSLQSGSLQSGTDCEDSDAAAGRPKSSNNKRGSTAGKRGTVLGASSNPRKSTSNFADLRVTGGRATVFGLGGGTLFGGGGGSVWSRGRPTVFGQNAIDEAPDDGPEHAADGRPSFAGMKGSAGPSTRMSRASFAFPPGKTRRGTTLLGPSKGRKSMWGIAEQAPDFIRQTSSTVNASMVNAGTSHCTSSDQDQTELGSIDESSMVKGDERRDERKVVFGTGNTGDSANADNKHIHASNSELDALGSGGQDPDGLKLAGEESAPKSRNMKAFRSWPDGADHDDRGWRAKSTHARSRMFDDIDPNDKGHRSSPDAHWERSRKRAYMNFCNPPATSCTASLSNPSSGPTMVVSSLTHSNPALTSVCSLTGSTPAQTASSPALSKLDGETESTAWDGEAKRSSDKRSKWPVMGGNTGKNGDWSGKAVDGLVLPNRGFPLHHAVDIESEECESHNCDEFVCRAGAPDGLPTPLRAISWSALSSTSESLKLTKHKGLPAASLLSRPCSAAQGSRHFMIDVRGRFGAQAICAPADQRPATR